MKRRRLRLLFLLLLILLAPILYLVFSICFYAYSASSRSADAAIVLGASVWGDRPSPVFCARIDHALDLYRSGRVRKIILTGGVPPGSTLADSEIARAYALGQGVPAQDLLCETTSANTLENLRAARAVMQRENLDTALIVSDPLHMRRAMSMAANLGLDASPSPTPTSKISGLSAKLRFLSRETWFYASYLLRGH